MIMLALELPQSAGVRYNSARKFKTIRPHVGDQPVKEFFELSNNNEFVRNSSPSSLSSLRKVGARGHDAQLCSAMLLTKFLHRLWNPSIRCSARPAVDFLVQQRAQELPARTDL
jgi:hypothetical protein